ncbi:MAG: thioesterase family protein [Anaerolineales bacterium]|nr:thioesterase family protein [Anaerolineales bacterium]
MGSIKIGMVHEAQEKVTPAKSAVHIGSGSLQVYSTPSMVSFVERSCHELMAPHLLPEKTSVGSHVDIYHLAPTPLGSTVRVRVEVIGVDGIKVRFTAEVWDEQELVGKCEHERAVIDSDRFLRRVREKQVQV